MARDHSGGWAPYVSVAERRKIAAREAAKLRKKNPSIAPIIIEGRTITNSFWGKAWGKNIESYRDYEYRLSRGRSCIRHGLVLDLQIDTGKITAIVSGSSLYTVSIKIDDLPPPKWQAICEDCSGGIDSLVELLQGRFSKHVMERLCRQNDGLFPRPAEIHFGCTCPDHASMCKHVAAALYGIGVKLDQQPDLLFRLRGVNETDLLANINTALPAISNKPMPSNAVLQDEDISALFDIEIKSSS